MSKSTALQESTAHINIIGSGKLGRTLVRLFTDHQLLQPGDFYNRSPQHSRAAVEFCGGGRICHALTEMDDAQIWLIATPDDAIAEVARALASSGKSWANTVVFHASGLHSSALLEPLKSKGAAVASAHPVHSFAEPQQSLSSYTGTACTIEGDSLATERLSTLFAQIGSTVIPVTEDGKALYHAATVVAANYLVALQQVALDMLEQAGIAQQDAEQILQPLMAQSLQNTRQNKPVKALTGPISRGDVATIAKHLDAIAELIPQHTILYQELGKVAVELARQQKHLDETQLAAMMALFAPRSDGPGTT